MKRKIMSQLHKRKNKIVVKNIVLSAIPAAIFPAIEIIPVQDELSKTIFKFIAIIFIIYSIWNISQKEDLEAEYIEERLKNYEKYYVSQKIVNSLSDVGKIKRNFLKRDKEKYDISNNVLLYSPHEYIESVCECIKKLISDITEINSVNFSVSFIYRYPTCTDNIWKWITRKEGTINQDLNAFVTNDNSNSYFHYIVSNNLSSYFQNNKEILVKNGNYWISEGDKRYSALGSIASYKISFIKNDSTRCVGYLTISTYGQKFVEDDNLDDIKKFNYLLSDVVIPPFRAIIESELGFLYERHILQNNDELSK